MKVIVGASHVVNTYTNDHGIFGQHINVVKIEFFK